VTFTKAKAATDHLWHPITVIVTYGVVDRFVHVPPYDSDDVDAPMTRVPVAKIFLYPTASRVTASGSVSPQHHVSIHLDTDNAYYVRADLLGRVVAFSPSARLKNTFAILYCHHLPGYVFKFTVPV
jgi:hypothetical protein